GWGGWRLSFGDRAPSIRGLKRNRSYDHARVIVKPLRHAPTTRGLKPHHHHRMNARREETGTSCPDEEGIETRRRRQPAGGPRKPTVTACPEYEGIET